MQERRDAAYLAILTGVWVLIGAWIAVLSHRLWLDNRDPERQWTRLAIGRGFALRLGPASEMVQLLLAMFGTVVAAALAQAPATHSRRP